MYRIINKDTGMFLRDDFTFNKETEIGLEVEQAQGLYQPKWDGEKWVEGATQEYIGSLQPQALEPTAEERLEALELAMLELVLGGAM